MSIHPLVKTVRTEKDLSSRFIEITQRNGPNKSQLIRGVSARVN